jgi:hypothetical protein
MNNNIGNNLIGGDSGTNEQFLERMLKQTYGKIGPILEDKEMHKAIDKCIINSVSPEGIAELQNFTKVCNKYSFITFLKHAFLLPQKINDIPNFLLLIIVILLVIILLLICILFNILFN